MARRAAAAAAAAVETLPSADLCRQIAAETGGVCLLGFSRGKDSIAAWLQLRRYFDRIIPFHVASVPHLQFVDESLAYYERVFGAKIDRFMCGHSIAALGGYIFQPPESMEDIDDLDIGPFENFDVAAVVRRDHDAPRAWCAFGINASDSIDRRIYVNKYGDRNERRRTFYPCYDWSKAQVLSEACAFGIKLPADYTMASRTFAGIPALRHLQRMPELFPNDYERVRSFYPLIDAQRARNEFRRIARDKSC